MTTLRERHPSFELSVVPKEATFITETELLAIPFLKDITSNPRFTHFATAEMGDLGTGVAPTAAYLMAQFKDKSWYCVGYLSDIPDYLPKWARDENTHLWGQP